MTDTVILQQIRDKIVRKTRRVREDIAYLEELTRPIAPENSLGRITRMDAINGKGVHEATLRQARQTLSQLEHALQRIDGSDPDFGTCSRCGAEIPPARLMLMPESDKCVPCAGKHP